MTLRHVAQAGSSSGVDAVIEAHNEEEIAEDEDSKKRTQRKMSRKRAREAVKTTRRRKCLKQAWKSSAKTSSLMANFNWVQEQQLNTMNTLVGALTNFF